MSMKKATKAQIKSYLKLKLGTDEAWALRALTRIFKENQTASEQIIESVTEDNSIGFTGTDGKILSSFAKQLGYGRSMSPKQMALIMKKMPKYWKQVYNFIPEDRRAGVAEDAIKA